jgi:cytochrome P450
VAVIDFDPFAAAALADPYPDFARFIEQQPVSWSEELGSWVVSRYADVKQALRRVLGRQRAGADHRAVPTRRPGPGRGRVPVDPDTDQRRPPAHTRTRRIAQAAFGPRRVAASNRSSATSCAASSPNGSTTGAPRSCRS